MSSSNNQGRLVRSKNNLRPRAVADATSRNRSAIGEVAMAILFVIGIFGLIVGSVLILGFLVGLAG